ncbi:MAG: hypothetical protein WAU78_08240 [Roseiarcus sp.]
MGGDEGAAKGVAAALPADLFENFSAGEAQLVADAAPFRDRPQPIGGSRKGVPNKRTQQMRELYLKSGFPHPLLWMGAMLRLGVDGLARELACPAIDAAELLRKIASDVAPYIEGKQPTKVVVDGAQALPVVVFGELAVARQAIADARDEGALAIDDDVDLAMLAYQQNQELSDDEGVRSGDGPSHDDAKPLNSQKIPSADR